METGKETALTSGEYAVLDVLYWNEHTNTIFYSANSKNAPHIKHIWSVQVSESGNGHMQCLTCNINRLGVPQTYFSAVLSAEGKHMLISNDGPSIPRTDIVQTPSNNSSNYIFIDKCIVFQMNSIIL